MGGGHATLTTHEMLLHFMLLLSATLAMASFYFTSSYSTMLWIYFMGVVGGIVIAVPDWAYFNRSPLCWLQPLGNEPTGPGPQHLCNSSTPRMKRVHSFQRLASPCSSSSGVQEEAVPFRLPSFSCFPTSTIPRTISGTIYSTTTSGGSRS